MRPPNGPARSSSIPPSPAIRKSSPILPIPARSSSSPTPKSATTEPAPPTTNPRAPTSKAWWCASSRPSPATGARDAEANSFLARAGIPVVSDLDTRALVRHLRTRGVMRGVLSATETDAATLWSRRPAPFPPWPVSIWPAASPPPSATSGTSRWTPARLPTWWAPPRAAAYHVVAYDFGIKRNILRRLVHVGCRVTVVPSLTSAEDVLALKPDGIFLSNGPGDPEPLRNAGRATSASSSAGSRSSASAWATRCSAWPSAARPTS